MKMQVKTKIRGKIFPFSENRLGDAEEFYDKPVPPPPFQRRRFLSISAAASYAMTAQVLSTPLPISCHLKSSLPSQ